jgi:hypothetical protein
MACRAGFFQFQGSGFVGRDSAEDRLGQGRFVETSPGVAVGESTVDDDGRQAADAVTAGRHRDGGIVHVANFDIVLGARRNSTSSTASVQQGQPAVNTSIFRR